MHINPIEVNQDDVRYPALNTAVEVFKGALAVALNIPLGRSTIGVNFPDINHVRMTVFTGSSEPVPNSVLQKVIDLSNAKVAENVSCIVTQLSREEAEKLYADSMYDREKVSSTESPCLQIYYIYYVLDRVLKKIFFCIDLFYYVRMKNIFCFFNNH